MWRGKGVLSLLALIAFAAGVIGAVMHRRAAQYPIIITEGIAELGLQLEIPGGGENPGDFVIRNTGEHTLIGYRVVYEGHAKSREVREWSKTVIQPLAFPENKDRIEYLSPTYSCIPPGAAVFGGLHRESQPQDGKSVPKLERVWVPQDGLESYERINVRLDAVMLEDGQIRGQNKGALIGRIRQSFEDEVKHFLGMSAEDQEVNRGFNVKE